MALHSQSDGERVPHIAYRRTDGVDFADSSDTTDDSEGTGGAIDIIKKVVLFCLVRPVSLRSRLSLNNFRPSGSVSAAVLMSLLPNRMSRARELGRKLSEFDQRIEVTLTNMFDSNPDIHLLAQGHNCRSFF